MNNRDTQKNSMSNIEVLLKNQKIDNLDHLEVKVFL